MTDRVIVRDLFSPPADAGDDDPFAQLVRSEGTQHFKAKQRAAAKREAKVKVVQSEADAPMKLTEQQQKLANTSMQFRIYSRGKRAELKALAKGTQGQHWRELIRLLRATNLEHESSLVEYVRAQAWLFEENIHTRQVYLGVIADRMIRLRIQNGFAPFDDSLPGEPPTVFEIIRNDLHVMT